MYTRIAGCCRLLCSVANSNLLSSRVVHPHVYTGPKIRRFLPGCISWSLGFSRGSASAAFQLRGVARCSDTGSYLCSRNVSTTQCRSVPILSVGSSIHTGTSPLQLDIFAPLSGNATAVGARDVHKPAACRVRSNKFMNVVVSLWFDVHLAGNQQLQHSSQFIDIEQPLLVVA